MSNLKYFSKYLLQLNINVKLKQCIRFDGLDTGVVTNTIRIH